MIHSWMLRPNPHGHNRMKEFRENNIIAIGWPGIGNLSGQSKENIKQILCGPPYDYTGHQLGISLATVDIFVNRMQSDDLVLVPNGDDIYFAKITSEYYYDETADCEVSGYPHQRKVEWLADTSRENLSRQLRDSLKDRRAAGDFHRHNSEIAALAYGQPYSETPSAESNISMVNVVYPLRANLNIAFRIPADITRSEAKRLSLYVESLYFQD